MSDKLRACECCWQPIQPSLGLDDYNARAIPRLAAIDRLTERIDFSRHDWRHTPEGERWKRLMDEQGRDELAAGL